jgi:hypothetical protein
MTRWTRRAVGMLRAMLPNKALHLAVRFAACR